jgi:hypothetical protein
LGPLWRNGNHESRRLTALHCRAARRSPGEHSDSKRQAARFVGLCLQARMAMKKVLKFLSVFMFILPFVALHAVNYARWGHYGEYRLTFLILGMLASGIITMNVASSAFDEKKHRDRIAITFTFIQVMLWLLTIFDFLINHPGR